MYIRCAHAALTLTLLAAPLAAQTPAHLAGFKAYLFNSRTGQLSPDVLGGKVELGNVPAGSYSSVSTFVVVRVELGPQAPVPANAQVHLVALEGSAAGQRPGARSRTLLDAIGRLGPSDEQGVSYVGFWLASTGCRAITLKATLSGTAHSAAPMSATLPFTCYE